MKIEIARSFGDLRGTKEESIRDPERTPELFSTEGQHVRLVVNV